MNEIKNVSKNKQEYVCLCYCSITVRDNMTKPTYKRKHLIVVLQFQKATPGHHGKHHGDRQAHMYRAVAESSQMIQKQEAERERTGPGMGF